jgi:hypothetical protein
MRALLSFRDPDGQIRTEILGRDDDFAELIDPDDGSVRHEGPFVMHGREWQIEGVRVTESLMRIMCVSTLRPFRASSPRPRAQLEAGLGSNVE